MESKKKVLIIEDNDDLRENTAEILELADFEVYQASSGDQGVEKAIAQIPDIILCDVAMPGLDGYETLNLLRQHDLTSGIPFIFLSGKSERMDIRKGMEMGADDYLTKPFEGVELFNAIDCRLRKKAYQNVSLGKTLCRQSDFLNIGNGINELERLFAERRLNHVRRKQIIYYTGDVTKGIYKVITGKVKTFKIAEDGRELLTGVFGPSNYFGVAALLAGEDSQEMAEAMENTVLSIVPKDCIEDLIGKYQDVSKHFFQLIATNLVNKEEQLVQVAYHSVRKRMAELLIRLRSNCGTTDLSTLGFSRSNLAEMAGVAMETASRILNDFKEEKLIRFTFNNQIILLNCDKLEKMRN